MEIAIIGKGLLGHTMSKMYGIPAFGREEIDITNRHSVMSFMLRHKPSVVINCAGVVPKAQTSYMQMLQTNAFAPHLLATVVEAFDARLIHISTDCVYSGKHPDRSEKDYPDPVDLYGMSKFLGEVTIRPHLTVRTSFIGLPDPKGHGLLYWASKQKKIDGYAKHLWNGLTTTELSRVLIEEVIPSKMVGKLHLFGETLSKHDLLQHCAEIFDWNVEITAVDEPASARTLSSIYPPYVTKDIVTMLREMKDFYGS